MSEERKFEHMDTGVEDVSADAPMCNLIAPS